MSSSPNYQFPVKRAERELRHPQVLDRTLQMAFMDSSPIRSPRSSMTNFRGQTAMLDSSFSLTSSALASEPLLERWILSMLLNTKQQATVVNREMAPPPMDRMNAPLEASFMTADGTTQPGARYYQQDNKQTLDASSKILKAMGSRIRKKTDPYVDASILQGNLGVLDSSSTRRSGTGASGPFPEKLYRILQEVHREGKSDIVSFYAHGRAFGIHDPNRFMEEIMPGYFKHKKMSSFIRQLSLYGFIRITSGPDTGGYYHELFLSGRPDLCLHMRRVGLPKLEHDRRKCRPRQSIGSDPNFYYMAPVCLW
jgi:hypothetical protein